MEKTIIVVHESIIASWLKDIFTFGSIALLLYLNEKYFNGNQGVAIILVLMAICCTSVKLGVNSFHGKEEAKKYIDKLNF